MRVVRWLVGIGQAVKRGDLLLEVETDKAVMEVEAISTGKLTAMHVQPEDEVTAGHVIATISVESNPAPPSFQGKPPAEVSSIGSGGMFAKNRADAAKATVDSFVPLSSSQRVVARRLQESKQTIPHFYLQTSANAEPLIARRQASAPYSIVWDAFFVHAAAKALGKFERMGFRFENDRLSPSEADAIGVAVDLEGELFVISVLGPAGKTPETLSSDIRAAVDKLRSGDPDARRLKPSKLTITNLGATGIESFTAIVNPPEAAILAIGKVGPSAVVQDGKIVPQQRVALTLSVDHRVVNGKYAAEFLQAIVSEIETL